MKDCTTCKYGHKDERLGIPLCHHPKRFSEDCVDFNMHEEKESEHLADARKTSPKDLEEAARQYFENPENSWEVKEVFIAGAKWGAELFAKIVRANLSEIGNNAQSQFEQFYFEITGTKMYGGYND